MQKSPHIHLKQWTVIVSKRIIVILLKNQKGYNLLDVLTDTGTAKMNVKLYTNVPQIPKILFGIHKKSHMLKLHLNELFCSYSFNY